MKAHLLFYLLISVSFIISCGTEKAQEQTAEEKPSTQIEGKEIEYSNDSTSMKGYVAYMDDIKGKRPGVILVHEWWGHNDYIRHRADMLAKLGYVAFALDMYGDGQTAEHPSDAGKFAGHVMSNMDRAKSRFEAGLKTLKGFENVDSNQIAAVGYCFGGSVVLSMANAGYDLDAAAAFHSGVELPIMPNEKPSARILVANGADDPMISQDQANAYKAAMDQVNADYKYLEYPNTTHAYTNPKADSLGKVFDLPLAYNAQADRAAWVELQALLANTFEPFSN